MNLITTGGTIRGSDQVHVSALVTPKLELAETLCGQTLPGVGSWQPWDTEYVREHVAQIRICTACIEKMEVS